MYACPKCNTSVKSVNKYVDHIESSHSIGSKKSIPCPVAVCKLTFHGKTTFYTHMKSHATKNPDSEPKDEAEISCRHCKELFTIQTIESHLKSLPDGSRILCPFCKSGSHPNYNAYKTHKYR